VCVGAGDQVARPAVAIAAARRAPHGELRVYPGVDHFDIYDGPQHELIIADQLAFLERHVLSDLRAADPSTTASARVGLARSRRREFRSLLRPSLQDVGSSTMFHRHWVKTTGRVLDGRIRDIWHDRTGMGDAPMPLHNYVVEFQAPNGELTKLEVEQHDTVDVSIGSEVPLLVSPDGSKAIFDGKDPRLDPIVVAKAEEEADNERFRAQLEG
jgi:hypothetical protein